MRSTDIQHSRSWAKKVRMNPVSIYRSSRKLHPAAILLLTLAFLSEGRIEDNSIIDAFSKCTSELRVKIQGSGKAKSTSEARTICKDNCKVRVADFKNIRCQQLCGDRFAYPRPKEGPACHLCYRDSGCYISLCQALMDLGVCRCVHDCEIATPKKVGTLQSVNGTSGDIRKKFDSALIERKE